jgi:hypothetical protein
MVRERKDLNMVVITPRIGIRLPTEPTPAAFAPSPTPPRLYGHKIIKCSCGEIIAQCRCPDRNKPVTVVEKGCEACKRGEAKSFTSETDGS